MDVPLKNISNKKKKHKEKLQRVVEAENTTVFFNLS